MLPEKKHIYGTIFFLTYKKNVIKKIKSTLPDIYLINTCYQIILASIPQLRFNKRRAFIISVFYSSISLINLSCRNTMNDHQQSRIHDLFIYAGNNKTQFEKVITHYKRPKDSLKLKAAYFLLSNLKDQYHYEGVEVNKYRNTFSIMDSIVRSGHGIFDRTWDSLQKIHPPPPEFLLQKVPDCQTITGDFLIQNIEDSFRAWQCPCSRSLSFEDFCRYILPYKLADEQPEEWKGRIQREYSWVLDSLKGTNDPITACKLINKELKKFFYINAKVDCPWDMNYSELLKTHTGKCSDATRFTAYVMRSFGIPIVTDLTPHWANKDVGHQWNALMFNGTPLYFTGTESDIGHYKIVFTRAYWIRRKRGKVYRITYEKNDRALANQVSNMEDIPLLFQNPHLLDVTKEYLPTRNVTIHLNGAVPDQKWVYLCTFNEHTWKPITWGKLDIFRRVTFSDLETGIVYLPVYFKNDDFIPGAAAFILNNHGDKIDLNPDYDERQKVTLYQKYPEEKSNYIFPGMDYELFFWDNKWISAGERHSTSDHLIYSVPSNALLWLRNLSTGKQERIFTYENNKQIWW